MCGIAGYVLKEGPAQLPLLRTMCDAIRHRGPDDEGFYLNGRCALGMRRLSIIDLVTGHQPIANEDGSLQVVFNGEIYNYQTIRQDLLARGHRFATNSDTETLVHLYEEEGTGGIHRLRGMFAYALWDQRRQRLLLVRDRFGKKPLYYAHLDSGLYFASELKCLRFAGVPLELDELALQLYFQLGYIPDPRSPFRAIRKLEPGSWLSYEPDGQIHSGRYWTLPAPTGREPAEMSEQDACRRIREVFDESVRLRMISDVPLGAFLSGGLDSSCVVASMARQSGQPVKTFSIGFEESDFNELEHAAAVARQYGTEHHQILVRPDSAGLVSRLVRHFDEPFGDSSAIPTFIVSEFAAQSVKVVLSGDGGDELFGGYQSFFVTQRQQKADALPLAVRRLLAGISELLPYAAYGKNYLRVISRPNGLERYFENSYAHYHLRRSLLAPRWVAPTDEAFLRSAFPACLLPNGADALSQAIYFESTSRLAGDMLVKVDRMSMANSLEVRCPLLDHELAELAASIPTHWKIRHGRGKQILVKALGERLPAGLPDRPKMGFGVPLEHWFRGALREMLWDHLTGRRFLERGMVSETFVRHLIQEHMSGRRNNSGWLWSLLMLELFLEESRTGSLAP